MDQVTEERLRDIVRQRIEKQVPQIEHSLRQIAAGNPLGAEPDRSRSVARITNKASLPQRDAQAMTSMIARTAAIIDSYAALPSVGATFDRSGSKTTNESQPTVGASAESLHGPSIELVGVEFLSRGRLAANAVGRVAFRSGRPQGSGFLVGPRLFLTNNHVIQSAEQAAGMIVQFDYEAADDGTEKPVTAFAFDAEACFVSDPIDGLDFTLIAIGPKILGEKALDSFGYLPLSDAKDKHMLGELANIIQHPQGDLKQIVVRENNLVSRDETVQVLHYFADTDRGSSGSPVCNNCWEPIALHHWGEPAFELKDALGSPLSKDVNEGIRISAIVAKLRDMATDRSLPSATRVSEVLLIWDSSARRGPVRPPSGMSEEATGQPSAPGAAPKMQSDGSITWTFPIEVSMRASLLVNNQATPASITVAIPPAMVDTTTGPEKARPKEVDFSDRGGYEPGFIPGFIVPLPDYSGVGYKMAKNQRPFADAEDVHELPYHHFSIFIRADRRLAAFTACNIDGRRLAAVNRATKTVNTDPSLVDLGAESSDDFRPDPRIGADEQMTIAYYSGQEIPGYPKPDKLTQEATEADKKRYTHAMNNRTARMFQKGHLTLRGDPAWGTEEEALAAESDTFFYTNAAPQIGYFNQGSLAERPASKGTLRWRAIETYVMRNAFTMRKRVSVFVGPVFDDIKDPDYRFGSKLPMKFWKLVVWSDGARLRSIALIGDQGRVIEEMTKGMPEAFEDEEEIARVSEFLTTVTEIEQLTGLNFGENVRQADVRAGTEAMTPAIDSSPDSLLGWRP